MSRSIAKLTRGSRRFGKILRTLGKYGLADLLGDNLPSAIRDNLESAEGERRKRCFDSARQRVVHRPVANESKSFPDPHGP